MKRLNKTDLTITNSNNNIIDYYFKDSSIDIEIIRNRYKIESKFLHYVSVGNEEKVLSLINQDYLYSIDRLPDYPVRNYKNLCITLNTLLRKSVENNNLDTYLIHLLSEQYAIKIENSKNINELSNIVLSMVKSYCDLVNEHSNKDYSTLISNAINLIKFNFKSDIDLHNISKSLYVHPNYLATKFKSETNYTITEFINHIRIKEAKILLKNTSMSISELAFCVGYNDSKYFAKVFKKLNEITPSKYRSNC